MKTVLMLAWLLFCYATAPKFVKLNINNKYSDNRLVKTGIMFIAPVVVLAILKLIGVVISITIMFIVLVVFAAMAAVALGIIKGFMKNN